jgi:hypothetical protein
MLGQPLHKGYDPANPIKTTNGAENLRTLFSLELKYMTGCDCEWRFYHDDTAPARTLQVDRPVLAPAESADAAAAPPPQRASCCSISAPPIARESARLRQWGSPAVRSLPLRRRRRGACRRQGRFRSIWWTMTTKLYFADLSEKNRDNARPGK